MKADVDQIGLAPASGMPDRAAAGAGASIVRSRLFSKYVALFVSVVVLALIANGAFEIWFSYQEQKASLIKIQHQQAVAAADKIEEFITQIQSQVGWTTQLPWTASTLDQRRFDALRLLRQVPAITELAQVDASGHEQLKVSRLTMDVVGSGVDYSNKPEFTQAVANKVYYGPVYFRRESEPYMTLSLAGTRRDTGVSIAQVNLKLIWDVVSAIKVGKQGRAYVVDADGRLLAHPDISLVLRNTDMSRLVQVQSARAGSTDDQVQEADDIGGHKVLTAYAPVNPLGWFVFVETPIEEAYAPLYVSIQRIGYVLLGALALAFIAGTFLARRMVVPIQALRAGAARLGSGDLSQRISIKTGDEVESLADQFNDMAGKLQESYAGLEHKVEQRTAELSEALEQQTATSKVLQVISSSPGELEPVFRTMLENATRICGAKFGALSLKEGDAYRVVAMHNAPPAYAELRQREPTWKSDGLMERLAEQAFTDKRAVQIADLTDGIYKDDPLCRTFTTATQARSFVIVPLLKENTALGVMAIYRQEVRPFDEKQVALLTNFASQAVIAIENTRLLTELRQSLEQQTATADVLQVISTSQSSVQPVLDAVVTNAARLCEALNATIYLREGDVLQTCAHSGPLGGTPVGRSRPLSLNWVTGRAVLEMRTIHVSDVLNSDEYPEGKEMALRFGHRATLAVPLLREGTAVGAILVRRAEVRPFTDKQIDLVQNFAAQAVIAIENTRLLSELRQSLDQQTATADVLSVISSSPGDLAPVFQAMLENAVRLCEATFGNMFLFDGEAFHTAALHRADPGYAEARRQPVILRSLHPEVPLSRLVRVKTLMQIADVRTEKAYIEGDAVFATLVDVAGARTLLLVPMLKDGELIGAIVIYRQEVRPFTDKQQDLVTNFASQAVIAIENTRLLSELRQALDQQTATADVLSVISSSPGDLDPVFHAMLENATRICEAKFGTLYRYDGVGFSHAAGSGTPPELLEIQRQQGKFLPEPGTLLDRVLQTRKVAHSADYAAEPSLGLSAKFGGARSTVAVPMLKEDELIGCIVIYRQEVRPFTENQIELVENFANQAVIAIENTRLLSELRQSLQQQTATADVLKLISRSTFDLQTVFETLVQSAASLCDADMGSMWRPVNDKFHRVASFGDAKSIDAQMQGVSLSAGRGTTVGRALHECKIIHILDSEKDTDYRLGEIRAVGGFHTMLGVPLLREGTPIGVLVLGRRTVRAFTDKQIELVQTFADQAVIAIENVRLFEDVQKRTEELSASLENLRAAQDRLVQSEKLASLGQLTAGIAHEIKNPLNFVNNFSGVSVELVDELHDVLATVKVDDKTQAEITEIADTLRGNLQKIVQHGKRADSIVKNMLLHSREGSGEHRAVDVNGLVEESLNLAYHGARAEKQGFNITLERSFDPAAGEVDLFPQEITRVLLNLISNGFYAATKRKTQAGNDGFEPILVAATKSLGDRVEIRIRDNGTGIPPEVKEKMFNPFFTTKPAGEGTGLGLSISHDIVVKQHAGSIVVDTEPGSFTEFKIVLPRNGASAGNAGGKA
jgi:GAF domain-containing protein/HAMP domain-containing protein